MRRGGFAGLRETRLVMSPRIFRGHQEAGTSSGIGRFVYLADASFLPHGETRMHSHKEIDVISIMVDGRIIHEGSMEDGQELNVDDIQIQRAGTEGFTHNEINPDDAKNRMIQIWVLPEAPGADAAYEVMQAQPNGRTRIYGGPADEDNTFAARTVIEVAHLAKGESLKQAGRCLVYVTTGAGSSADETLREGDLVDTRDFSIKALSDAKLIIAYEM